MNQSMQNHTNNITSKWNTTPEAYSEPSRKSKKEHFAKIVNGLQVLNIFAKNFVLDV